ncbi:MAG: tRNA pseudouridine(55) synthase TruB [Burkholderiaceae bacterium]|jgi:tRNA pseudouridine55 synthase
MTVSGLPKRKRRPVHGVLLLNKPLGVSSNQALQTARRLFAAEKTGHTGTLDPLASGLLPLLFGEATKFSADLLDADKSYEAVIELGQTSATGDAEGPLSVTAAVERCAAISRSEIEAVLEAMEGAQLQLPPMYSALKHQGKALYEYAREGIELERTPRPVVLHRLRLLDMDLPRLTIAIDCSKGTYVRVLAADLGQRLGTGAYLAGLHRTRVGSLTVEQAYTPDGLQALLDASPDALAAALQPVDSLLQKLPPTVLDADLSQRFRHGQRLPLGMQAHSGRTRVYGPAANDSDRPLLLGTAFLNNDGQSNSLLSPERLIRLES